MIYAAAVDKRIKAAIVQCSAISGDARADMFKGVVPALLEDRARIAAGQPGETIPIIAEDQKSAEQGSSHVMFRDIYAYNFLKM